MAETQWSEYDEPTFEFDIDTDFFVDIDNPAEDIDIPVAIDALMGDDFGCCIFTVTTLALGEDDPSPLEADVRVVSVSDLA